MNRDPCRSEFGHLRFDRWIARRHQEPDPCPPSHHGIILPPLKNSLMVPPFRDYTRSQSAREHMMFHAIAVDEVPVVLDAEARPIRHLHAAVLADGIGAIGVAAGIDRGDHVWHLWP